MNPCRWSVMFVVSCVATLSALSACSSDSATSAAAGSAGTLTVAGANDGGDSGAAGSGSLGDGGSAAGGAAGAPSFGGIGGTFVGGSSGATNRGGGSGGAPMCSGLPATSACTTTSTDGFITCDESTGSSFASAMSAAETQSACVGQSGTLTPACSTRSVYGQCIHECGQADESITYYYDALAGDGGKSTCEHEGSTWDGP